MNHAPRLPDVDPALAILVALTMLLIVLSLACNLFDVYWPLIMREPL